MAFRELDNYLTKGRTMQRLKRGERKALASIGFFHSGYQLTEPERQTRDTSIDAGLIPERTVVRVAESVRGHSPRWQK
jgi:hypothetical protein